MNHSELIVFHMIVQVTPNMHTTDGQHCVLQQFLNRELCTVLCKLHTFDISSALDRRVSAALKTTGSLIRLIVDKTAVRRRLENTVDYRALESEGEPLLPVCFSLRSRRSCDFDFMLLPYWSVSQSKRRCLEWLHVRARTWTAWWTLSYERYDVMIDSCCSCPARQIRRRHSNVKLFSSVLN